MNCAVQCNCKIPFSRIKKSWGCLHQLLQKRVKYLILEFTKISLHSNDDISKSTSFKNMILASGEFSPHFRHLKITEKWKKHLQDLLDVSIWKSFVRATENAFQNISNWFSNKSVCYKNVLVSYILTDLKVW